MRCSRKGLEAFDAQYRQAMGEATETLDLVLSLDGADWRRGECGRARTRRRIAGWRSGSAH